MPNVLRTQLRTHQSLKTVCATTQLIRTFQAKMIKMDWSALLVGKIRSKARLTLPNVPVKPVSLSVLLQLRILGIPRFACNVDKTRRLRSPILEFAFAIQTSTIFQLKAQS